MKRCSRTFLGRVLPVILVACSTDPGISGGPGTSVGGTPKPGTAGGSAAATGSLGNFDPNVGVRAGASGGGATDEGRACSLEKFDLERNPPELLLVLDRSGSMNIRDGRMTSRWDETTAGLNETLKSTENLVHWGLKMFPSVSGCGVTLGVEEDVKPANYTTVFGRITTAGFNNTGDGGTPTAAAMNAAVAYLKTRTTKNPKFIVLATDGEPNCAANNANANGRDGAIASIAAAVAAGFRTYVIGIATAGSGASATLDLMADAGKAPRMGTPRYFPVNIRQDLIATLNMIAGQISTCVFPLSKAPPSLNAAVKIDGVTVNKDPANGWSYGAGDKSIQLNGMSCERLKNVQKANVSITFACPGVIIP